MKILLISPVISLDNKNIKEMFIPALGLYFLEGLTPPQHEVKIVEEEIDDLNLNEDCDLVGISCMTANVPRAYELAGEFKKRGKTVVLGGVHPTIMPDEALQYADSVIIGEAENVWEKMLDDWQRGELNKKYYSPEPSLDRFIPLNYKKLKRGGVFKPLPLFTTRGCPYHCYFCSVDGIYGEKIRHLPIANIVRYIKESRSKIVFFQDDNIVSDPVYAKELFKALVPLKIKWAAQASISIAEDSELLKLATESGCKGFYVGIESVSEKQLKFLEKEGDNINELARAIKKIRQAKIHVHAAMVFGFDTDTKEIFNQTVAFLIKNKISGAAFSILTPYPNLKIFDEMKKAGRLLTRDWRYYGHNTVVFKPRNMTAQELQSGVLRAKKQFYSWPSIIRRFWGNFFFPPLFIATNYLWRKDIRVTEKKYRAGIGLPDYLEF